LIGEVILEKNKQDIRTVVNKTEKITDQFRVLPMELIAGDDSTIVTLQESGCSFTFDFKNVFWNSRLENEHMRLISLCKPGDIVCDVFAGVGPFSVPLARKGIQVFANDLNAHCYDALVKNADNNLTKRKRQNFNAYCMDGRDFMKFCVEEICIKKGKSITHVFMNLPRTAYEFLDALIGVFPQNCQILPTIHCYCFSSGENTKQEAITKIENILGHNISPDAVYKVRVTAGDTVEYCVSFKLPSEIALKKN